MKLIVKVDPQNTQRNPPGASVKVLRGVAGAGVSRKSFPACAAAQRRLVAVTLPDARDAKTQRATLKALGKTVGDLFMWTRRTQHPL